MSGLKYKLDIPLNSLERTFLAVQVHSILSRANVDALLSDESIFLAAVQLRLERLGQLEAHGLGRGNRDRLA